MGGNPFATNIPQADSTHSLGVSSNGLSIRSLRVVPPQAPRCDTRARSRRQVIYLPPRDCDFPEFVRAAVVSLHILLLCHRHTGRDQFLSGYLPAVAAPRDKQTASVDRGRCRLLLGELHCVSDRVPAVPLRSIVSGLSNCPTLVLEKSSARASCSWLPWHLHVLGVDTTECHVVLPDLQKDIPDLRSCAMPTFST